MQIFRKISAFLLALLVLLGSTSFTVNMHLCMGQVEHVAVLKTAKACEMAHPPTSSPNKQQGQSENGCCEDETIRVEGIDEVTVERASIFVPVFQFMPALYVLVSYLTVETNGFDYTGFYNEYPPPLIGCDIPVFVQSFLL